MTTDLGIKNFAEIALSRTISEINAFYAEIQDGCPNGGKKIFGKNWQLTVQIP